MDSTLNSRSSEMLLSTDLISRCISLHLINYCSIIFIMKDFSANVRPNHTLGGTALTCYISHSVTHRKMADFDPSES